MILFLWFFMSGILRRILVLEVHLNILLNAVSEVFDHAVLSFRSRHLSMWLQLKLIYLIDHFAFIWSVTKHFTVIFLVFVKELWLTLWFISSQQVSPHLQTKVVEWATFVVPWVCKHVGATFDGTWVFGNNFGTIIEATAFLTFLIDGIPNYR